MHSNLIYKSLFHETMHDVTFAGSFELAVMVYDVLEAGEPVHEKLPEFCGWHDREAPALLTVQPSMLPELQAWPGEIVTDLPSV